MPLDMTPPTERFQIVEIVGSAALVERRDVVGLQAARTPAHNATPAVALEGRTARRRPSGARRRESAQDSLYGTMHLCDDGNSVRRAA